MSKLFISEINRDEDLYRVLDTNNKSRFKGTKKQCEHFNIQMNKVIEPVENYEPYSDIMDIYEFRLCFAFANRMYNNFHTVAVEVEKGFIIGINNFTNAPLKFSTNYRKTKQQSRGK